jgi:hypothetical protein
MSEAAAEITRRPRLFECEVPVLLTDRGDPFRKSIFAATRGKARYEYLRDLRDAGWDVSFKDIRVRSGDSIPLEKVTSFSRTAHARGLPFAHIGMRVEVEGHPGILVGSNDSGNFDVFFTGGPPEGQTGNCHPHWQMRYLAADGSVLASFEEP